MRNMAWELLVRMIRVRVRRGSMKRIIAFVQASRIQG